MNSQRSDAKLSQWLPLGMVVIGWAATAAAWSLVDVKWDAPYQGWGSQTLAVAVLVSAVMAVTAIEAARTWHRSPTRLRPLGVAWMFLATGIWFFGGLATALVYLGFQDACSGTGGGSSACLQRSGPGLESVGWLLTLSTTGVLAVMFWSGRRSRVAGALAPALIIGLYLLAVALWQPHAGFGVPLRHVNP